MGGSASSDSTFTYAVFKRTSMHDSRRISRHDIYSCERALAVDDVVELTEGRYVVADVWLPTGGRRGSAFVRPAEGRRIDRQ
jgi:hypothetical protein